MANLKVANEDLEGSASRIPDVRNTAAKSRQMAPTHGPEMFRNFNLALPQAEKLFISPDRKQALGLGKVAHSASSTASNFRSLGDLPNLDSDLDALESQNVLSSASTEPGDSLNYSMQQTHGSFLAALRVQPEESRPMSDGSARIALQAQQSSRPMSDGSARIALQAQQSSFGPRLLDTHTGWVGAGEKTMAEELLGRHLIDARLADQEITEPWYGSERTFENFGSRGSERSKGSQVEPIRETEGSAPGREASTGADKKSPAVTSAVKPEEANQLGIPLPRMAETAQAIEDPRSENSVARPSPEFKTKHEDEKELDIERGSSQQRLKEESVEKQHEVRQFANVPNDKVQAEAFSVSSYDVIQATPKSALFSTSCHPSLEDSGSEAPPSPSPQLRTPKSPAQLLHAMTNVFGKKTRRALYDFVEMDIQAQQSCRSLPFTIAFWLVFVITQLAHRQVSLAYEIQSFTSSLLENPVPSYAISNNSRTTEVTDDGLTLDSVTSLYGIYDWIDRSVVPLVWNDQAQVGISYVSSFNRVIGGARLQQTRLVTDTCPGGQDLNEYFESRCYSRSKELNGTTLNPLLEGFSSNVGDVFTYWLDIYQTIEETHEQTRFLKDESWLDVATNQVSVQLALYNEQVALFSFSEISIQIDLSGQLYAHTKVKVLPTQVYGHISTVIGDVVMIAMLCWLAIGEIFKMYSQKIRKYLTPYAVLNWTLIVQGCGLVAFFAWLTTGLGHLEDEIKAVAAPPPNTVYLPGGHLWDDRHQKLDILYDHMRSLTGLMNAAEFFTFMYTMIMVFKFFEAFHGNPRLALLTRTFFECIVDVAHFLIVFGTIFSNFAFGGYFMFGNQLADWSNYSLAFMATFRTMMGDFDFASMYAVAPVSATAWFIGFMVLIFLVMLNMLLAIIMDVYQNVKEESRMHMSLIDQSYFLMQAIKIRTKALLKRRTLAEDYKLLEEIVKSRDENDDAPISVEFLTSRGLDRDFAEHIVKCVPEDDKKSVESEEEFETNHEEATTRAVVPQEVIALLERVAKLQVADSKSKGMASSWHPIDKASSPMLPDAIPEPIADREKITDVLHLPGSMPDMEDDSEEDV